MKGHPLFRDNTLESDEVKAFRGGIRRTLFGFKANLTKFPLVFSDGRIKPFDGSTHWVDSARIADMTCVLFHYKLLDGYLREQARQAVREEHHYNNSAEYKRYLEVLEGNPSLRVKHETAREIEGVNDLLENGFVVVSKDYVSWVNAEEKRTFLPGSRQNVSSEDLLRMRRQNRAKTLRIQRLEKQLRDLSQQLKESDRSRRRLRRRVRTLKGRAAGAQTDPQAG
jgi:hypothetical protein